MTYQVPPPTGGSPGGVIISDDGDDEAGGKWVGPKIQHRMLNKTMNHPKIIYSTKISLISWLYPLAESDSVDREAYLLAIPSTSSPPELSSSALPSRQSSTEPLIATSPVTPHTNISLYEDTPDRNISSVVQYSSVVSGPDEEEAHNQYNEEPQVSQINIKY